MTARFCPFCGSGLVEESSVMDITGRHWWYCEQCVSDIQEGDLYEEEEPFWPSERPEGPYTHEEAEAIMDMMDSEGDAR